MGEALPPKGVLAMLKVEQRMDIKELHQAGHSARAISELTGHSRNTVKKVLRGEHATERRSRSTSSKLDPFKQYVTEQYGLSAVRLLEETGPMGYEGSVDTLRRYLRTLKVETHRKRKLTVRFETVPGKQAQADWGYCGKHELPMANGSLCMSL